jgi:hypothetical protein
VSTVISAKIPRKLKEKAKRYGVRIGEVVRRALEAEVRRIEEQEISTKLDELRSALKDQLTNSDVTKAVRSSRDER